MDLSHLILVRRDHSWLRIHPRCQPPTQKHINIGMGCASSAGHHEDELGVTFEEKCPLQGRNHDKIFFKKREIGSGKRRLRVAKAGKKKPLLGITGR